MNFDPSQTYIALGADGVVSPLPGGDAFWSLPAADIEQFGHNWLVTEFVCSADWPSWERHPEADEFIYLLSGSATVHLESSAGRTSVTLRDRGAVVVPRGVWHTAHLAAPSRFLFVTMGAGTEHRPANQD